ncbi:MAG: CheR family methyltransferase [Spirochaetota bacterium]
MQTNTERSVTSIAERRALNGTVGRRSDRRDENDYIDFKMVTFSLGGKDYGIDIMKVKEIAKFRTFTYVPNTPEYVRGVYNLRGDIISIIDLRIMFNLAFDELSEGSPHDGLIIRLEENMLGIIVDSIARVVGISRSSIQPPHPIFADINLKYIEGVVEHNDRLYIILDVERIFARDGGKSAESAAPDALYQTPSREVEDARDQQSPKKTQSEYREDVSDDVNQSVSFEFVRDTLATFAGFHVSPVNSDWVGQHFHEWTKERESEKKSIQFESSDDAQRFLEPFYSRDTGRFWSSAYVNTIRTLLPSSDPGSFYVWNAGCGSGYETYSITAVLASRFPEARIKVWAQDKDLLKVSSAPNLVFPERAAPEEFRDYVVSGTNGSSFSAEIKDRIVFEYHNVLNTNTLPAVDIVLARDLLSFLDPEEQQTFINHAIEKLKPGGLIIVGEHEKLDHIDRFSPVEAGISGIYQIV